jgi:hypothetical protein
MVNLSIVKTDAVRDIFKDLFSLQTYSSNLNPIEKMWVLLKKTM